MARRAQWSGEVEVAFKMRAALNAVAVGPIAITVPSAAVKGRLFFLAKTTRRLALIVRLPLGTLISKSVGHSPV